MNVYERLIKEFEGLKKQSTPSENPYEIRKKVKKSVLKALKDLDDFHNESWAIYMLKRNEKNMEKIAIKYRGNLISYHDMYEKAYSFACSLKEMGVKKGQQVPVCISNIPEFVYLFLACSFIGAKINVFGEWFDNNYLKKIIKDTNSDVIFVSDDVFEKLAIVIDSTPVNNIVVFSLEDSLMRDKNGVSINPYEEIDSKFHNMNNKVKMFSNLTDKRILNQKQFLEVGQNYNGNVLELGNLDDICTITYTSGTTNPSCPKGIIHSNRSYITLSRFKDSDVSGMPTMKDLTVLAHIPTYTHMELTCAISDTFYCNCCLAMEPFYNKDFFPYSLLINKPNFVPASVGFWMNLCKKLNFDESWKNITMPYLMIPTVTGESCSNGEEKFFNYTARKHKFGVEKLPFPLSPVTFSIGGGTSECSGIFVTLFKSLQEKRLDNLLMGTSLGLTPHRFVELEVLDDSKKYTKIGEPGNLVVNSPCNMIGYVDENLNKSAYIEDYYGKTWLNSSTYSYKSDNTGRIKMKGRLNSNITLSSGEIVPFYLVEDIILLDTKNIMSCSVVKISDNIYVCHIEMQPFNIKGEESTLKSCACRLRSFFSEELLDKLYLRLRSFEESFSVSPSGKRNLDVLIEEGINDKCKKVSDFEKTTMSLGVKTKILIKK